MTENEIIDKLQLSMELAGDGGVSPFSDDEYKEMTTFLDSLRFISNEKGIFKIYFLEQIKKMVYYTRCFRIALGDELYIYKTKSGDLFITNSFCLDEEELDSEEKKCIDSSRTIPELLDIKKRLDNVIESLMNATRNIEKNDSFDHLMRMVMYYSSISHLKDKRAKTLYCYYYDVDENGVIYDDEHKIEVPLPWKSKNKIDSKKVEEFFEEHWDIVYKHKGGFSIY